MLDESKEIASQIAPVASNGLLSHIGTLCLGAAGGFASGFATHVFSVSRLKKQAELDRFKDFRNEVIELQRYMTRLMSLSSNIVHVTTQEGRRLLENFSPTEYNELVAKITEHTRACRILSPNDGAFADSLDLILQNTVDPSNFYNKNTSTDTLEEVVFEFSDMLSEKTEEMRNTMNDMSKRL